MNFLPCADCEVGIFLVPKTLFFELKQIRTVVIFVIINENESSHSQGH